MKIPHRFSRLLIERQACVVCDLLPLPQFVSFCRDRHIGISHERLLKFDQLEIFFPMLRIYRPEIVRKVEYVDGGRSYRDLGLLKSDEMWTGPTETELAQFGFPPLTLPKIGS